MNEYLEKFIKETFKTPNKALDLGAGKFKDIMGLKQKGWFCEGVDKNMGVDLEKPYLSKNRPFDLVYSNYVLHKLKNKTLLIKTAFDNLKNNGWFFLHTFDQSDRNSNSDLTKNKIMKMLKEADFKNIKTKVFDYYDKEHRHWHRILEAVAQK